MRPQSMGISFATGTDKDPVSKQIYFKVVVIDVAAAVVGFDVVDDDAAVAAT